jgi:hypothetical protein
VIHSIPFGALNSLTLPVFDEASLHLSNHAQNCQNDVTQFAPRRNMGIEYRYKCTLLLTLMDDIKYVSGVAAEPIAARYDKLIARTEKIDNRCQFSATFATAARYLFRPDDLTALSFELRLLQV